MNDDTAQQKSIIEGLLTGGQLKKFLTLPQKVSSSVINRNTDKPQHGVSDYSSDRLDFVLEPV